MKTLINLVLVAVLALTLGACSTVHTGNSGKILAHVDEEPALMPETVVEEDFVAVNEEESPVLYHGPKPLPVIEKVKKSPFQQLRQSC